ncbi:MAG TPA: protein kinase [Polyangiaceae bacterium]|nr:protein kinase [Polyangiaceae bacterium]
MASVWIARHTGKHGFEKFVAIKTVLPKFAADARFQQMFQDEARIASRIEHANVAQILDVGEQHEITYLVMEYVDGESLSTVHRTLTKKGMKVPPGVILRVLADVCGGLHTAHELREEDGQLLGVVHRDVSPQNVLVSGKGIAKLIDFGIAKARDRIAGDTSAGQVKGKIRYMAPEQALGANIDRRADLWAVGAILYHLLAGKPPYDGDNDVQALMVLTSGRPPVPLPASVHPAIAAIVKRALTANVDARYSTAAEMQQALEDAMVEAKIATNPAAVATFLAEHVADRAKKRKEAIGIGMKAAAERERYAEIMRSNIRTTGSSTSMASAFDDGSHGTGSGSRSGVGSNPGVGSRSGVGSNPTAKSKSGVGSNPGPGSRSGVAGQGPISGAGNSVVTSGTLGSAAMDVGEVRPARGRAVAFASLAAGAVLGIGGLVVMLTRPSSDHVDSKPATMQPPVAVSATATPPAVVTVTTPWTATAPPPATPPTADANTAEADTTIAASALRPAPPPVTGNVGGVQQGPTLPPRPTFRPVPSTKPGAGHTKPRVDDGF